MKKEKASRVGGIRRGFGLKNTSAREQNRWDFAKTKATGKGVSSSGRVGLCLVRKVRAESVCVRFGGRKNQISERREWGGLLKKEF